jgi:hypothetical protein
MRRFLPNFAELIDRFCIDHLKYTFLAKDNYAQSVEDMAHDIDELIKEKDIKLDANMIQDIIILAQYNTHIWYNESAVRNGLPGAKLELTHSLNGLRSVARNRITSRLGETKGFDFKVDCLAADHSMWNPHWISGDGWGNHS